MGRKGEADVASSTRPADEKKWWTRASANRRLVMHNDFVVVGPAADPAKIKGLPKRAGGAPGASPARASALHLARRQLGDPRPGEGALEGGGARPEGRLVPADRARHGRRRSTSPRRRAATRSPTAAPTSRSQKGRTLALEILVEGEPRLLNVYHVIEVNPAQVAEGERRRGGKAFADFMVARRRPRRSSAASAWRSTARRSSPRTPARRTRTSRSLGRPMGLFAARRSAKAIRLLGSGDAEVLADRPAVAARSPAPRRGDRCCSASRSGRAARAQRASPGSALVVSLVNTGMGLPPVVVGPLRDDPPLAQRRRSAFSGCSTRRRRW